MRLHHDDIYPKQISKLGVEMKKNKKKDLGTVARSSQISMYPSVTAASLNQSGSGEKDNKNQGKPGPSLDHCASVSRS
ncbi:hypothetical protein GALMADRAFT_813006 [Galerina marginata CBS 339.88]|uniref:Uncharacterized protein n=1 Tax=Galerina marginata (strain CBS 339.88) TaxID=685588 RepID=A0A067SVW3_GALM3|nr:hypothetical protein GALMADRAFT_813006 [Galerina marginata CBS 339.88]